MRLLGIALVRKGTADVGVDNLRAAQGNLESTIIQLPTPLTNPSQACLCCRKHVEMMLNMPMLQ
jgi:hypothetical protein